MSRKGSATTRTGVMNTAWNPSQGASGRRAVNAGGFTPTTLPTTPSIQYHPHTATLTMRADSTFTGYIIPRSGSLCSTLVVTAWSTSTSQSLKQSMVLTGGGAAAGTTIVSGAINDSPAGFGGVGRYLVTGVNQTVGSVGTPVTFTAAAQQVLTLPDRMGRATLTSSDNRGPEIKVDGLGRTFLRFSGTEGVFAWLRNITVTGLDTHNIAWFMVCRFPSAGQPIQTPGNNTIVGVGANELGGVPAQSRALGLSVNFPNSILSPSSSGTAVATQKRMLIGSQIQVVGTSSTTTDGVAGATTTTTGRTWLNETSTSTTSSAARGINVTGMTLNASALAAGANLQCQFDLYELNGYILGELGTPSQSQARGDAIVSSMMTNWGILPIARSLVILGDSRIVYGTGGVASGGNDTTNITVPSLISDPSANGIPADVRVTNWGSAGTGIGFLGGVLDQAYNNFATSPCPLASAWMLGGGADYFTVQLGTNEVSVWPSSNVSPLGGTQVSASNAFVDDYYNGAGYTTTFTASVSAGGQSVTATSISPSFVYGGMALTGTGWSTGVSVTAYTTASPIATRIQQITTLTSVATTATLSTYQQVIAKLLSRGFKGVWFAEWQHINAYFQNKVNTSALTDAQAGPAQTYYGKLTIADFSGITVNAKVVFGTDMLGYDAYQLDNIHMTALGKANLVSGGDTPANGMLAKVKTLLST